jgi:carboxymethylenebutenolidase
MVGFRDAGSRRIAKRFAEEGYVALIPDLYDRPGLSGPGGGGRWIAGLPEVDTSRFGVAGFCLGSGFPLLHAARAPVAVDAVFYGDVPDTADDLQGVCPVLASYAGKDRLFRAKGRRLKRHLEEIHVPHDLEIYSNAGHAFMDRPRGLFAWILRISSFRVAHDEEASEDSWRRMFAFFRQHLGSQAADQAAAAERRLR